MQNPITLLKRYIKGRKAAAYARAQGLCGMQFDAFGRNVALRLLTRLAPGCTGYLVAPVANVRYWEFPFTLNCLPETLSRCLDVASPRLFSLYVARHRPDAVVDLINPDPIDHALTHRIATTLALSNVHVRHCAVDVLKDDPAATAMHGPYDCIWSISVIEHIRAEYDERQALKWMYDALRPGGRLILTVPVDRQYQDEYREYDAYALQQGAQIGGKYFFQRVYDQAAVRDRIVASVGHEPAILKWYGETTPGKFRELERNIITAGVDAAVDEPRQMADHFREFPSWAAMPGFGICGIMFEKRS